MVNHPKTQAANGRVSEVADAEEAPDYAAQASERASPASRPRAAAAMAHSTATATRYRDA